jgi:hypothetical protein
MTILYIKTHNVTGLKYFGKTQKSDYHKYRGSGSYWCNHIKKYGYDVTTEMYAQFDETNIFELKILKDVAMSFSLKNNIVSSDEWANQILEYGTDGYQKGYFHSSHTLLKLSKSRKMVTENGKTVAENASIKASETKKSSAWKNKYEKKRIEKFRKTIFEVDENGIKKSTKIAINSAKTMSKIKDNGKSIRQEATSKMIKTKNIRDEYGKTIWDKVGEKTSKRMKDPLQNKNIGSNIYNNGIKEIRINSNIIPDGFVKGRLQVGSWYNNGELQNRFFENEIPEGYSKGKIKKYKFNNGIVEVYEKECPEGFVLGQLFKKSWFTNGIQSKLFKENEIPPIGWYLGRTL